ncbi:MAG: hypothetical protein H7343_08950 [Undibacterium sp.]|nr:hypothetical protein [Opitutaceae bacterium]
MPSLWHRMWPGLLIGSGATLIFSAVMNLVSAVILIEPSDAAALGISRAEVLVWYGAVLLAGGLLVGLGVRRRRLTRK